jgi:hypothetical protein
MVCYKVNNSQTYFKSKLVQTAKVTLSVLCVNYRILDFVDSMKEKEPSLNSPLQWPFLQSDDSGTEVLMKLIQEHYLRKFTYLEVQQDKVHLERLQYQRVQELQEFEVAPFIDQAKYIGVYLPNQCI